MTADHPADLELMEFAAGGLPAEAAAKTSAHLQACARCKDVLASLSETTSPSGKHLTGPDPLIGMQLGEYRVLERLGQGGMGVLYRGEQPVIGKPVAIKVLLMAIAADPVLVQRMVGEARAANLVRHPNIIDIFSLGHLPDSRPYMVMELLQGRSLADLLAASGRLTAEQTVTVLSQAMAGLEAAHAAGVIHRDLKPDNIYIDARPDGWRLKLIDFGLAKREGIGEPGLTAPGMVMGTPSYMAPEQVRGKGEVSTWTDIYSMGIVAWTLLVGHEPFQGNSAIEVMHQQLRTPVPPLRPLSGPVPPRLEELVMQMLEKEPAKRPTATQARAILEQLASPGRRVEAPKPVVPPDQAATQRELPPIAGASRGGRRGLRLALVFTVIALGSGLALAGWWLNASGGPLAQPPPEPTPIARPPAPPAPDEPAPVTSTAPPPVVPTLPVAPAPVGPGGQVTWRCSKVLEVGELDRIINAPWILFIITIEEESQLFVTAPRTARGKRQLLKLQKAVKDCRETAGTLTAQTLTAKTLITTRGVFRGDAVDVESISVERSSRPRK